MSQRRSISVSTSFLTALCIALLAYIIAFDLRFHAMMRPHLIKAINRLTNVPLVNRAAVAPLSASISSTFYTPTALTTPIHTSRAFSTSKMASQMSFLDAVRNRRSVYPLTNKVPISEDRIVEIATEGIKHVPSSFNSQSARMVVLLNAEHEKFWDMTKEVLRPQVPADKFGATEQKLDMFKAAKGTVRERSFILSGVAISIEAEKGLHPYCGRNDSLYL